jgi:DNA-binding transcriptional ArsR family regulator
VAPKRPRCPADNLEIKRNFDRVPCTTDEAPLIYNYMVVRQTNREKADRLFHALADGTRRDILSRSLQGEHSVSTLASFYPMSFAAVQKHVTVLARAELVSKRRRGREQLVRGNVEELAYASELLRQFEWLWRSRIDRFGEVLSNHLEEGTT